MLKHQDLLMFGFKLLQIYMNIFHPLEVVGRGSETQLQVGENYISKVAPPELMPGLMLGQCSRRLANIKPTSPQCVVRDGNVCCELSMGCALIWDGHALVVL